MVMTHEKEEEKKQIQRAANKESKSLNEHYMNLQ